MANAFKQVDLIAAEALTIMSDEMVIGNLAMRDKSSDFNVKPNGYAIGDTIRIKSRPDYTVNEFSTTISAQAIREATRSMQIEKHYDVSVQMTAKEKTLDMDGLTEQVIRPAARRLAEQVDTYLGTKILLAGGMYASDTLFETAADIALARKAATQYQLESDRYVIMDLALEATLLGKDFFNQSQTRGIDGTNTLRTGMMGSIMGMDFYSSANFPATGNTHTTGSATAVTNNTSGTKNLIGDSYLTFDAGTAAAIQSGDFLLVAGCPRPFVAAEQIADASGDTEVLLRDPIDVVVPDDAAITIVGSGAKALTYQGAIFDSRAIAAAFPMLDTPSDKPAYAVSDGGVSIRVVQGYDMSTKTETLSLDLLVGATAYDPRRITLLGGY